MLAMVRGTLVQAEPEQRQHADQVVTVNDDEAVEGMRDILLATHNLPEGAGALAYAALKKHRETWTGKKIACVLSGGNASVAMMRRVLEC